MNYIKPYQIFDNNQEHPGFPKTKEEVKKMCKNFGIEEYLINDDLSIDVYNHFRFPIGGQAYIPLNFNEITGNFTFRHSSLKSLKGCPKIIGGSLDVSWNNLRSFEDGPNEIKRNLICNTNNIKTLKGFPKVNGKINIKDNSVYSLINTFINKNNQNELINEFNHYRITDGKKVYMGRLEMFCGDFDLEMPNTYEIGKQYEVI